MKKLIINADDFGFTTKINQGIINSFLNGVLTSTSLMATGEAFDEAIELSRQHSSLSIGIHISLVDTNPVSPPSQIPTLVNSDAKLFRDYRQFFKKFLLKQIKLEHVENELKAQIEKVKDFGIEITHIDSHQHIHIFPGILDVVLELAARFNIRWIRNCYDASASSNGLGQRGLAFVAKKGKKKIMSSGLQTSDHFLGTAYTGKIKKDDLIHMLENLPSGVTEIMTHPGEYDEQLAERYANNWGCGWKEEQDALVSEEVKATIMEKSIELTNYHEI